MAQNSPIYEDDEAILEHYISMPSSDFDETELSTQYALLAMRIKRYERNTGRRFTQQPGSTKKFWTNNADKSKMRCYHCQKLGHLKSECRSFQRSNAGPSLRQPSQQQPATTSTPPQKQSLLAGEFDWDIMEDNLLDQTALMADINEVTSDQSPSSTDPSSSSLPCTDACKSLMEDLKSRNLAICMAAMEKDDEIEHLKVKLGQLQLSHLATMLLRELGAPSSVAAKKGETASEAGPSTAGPSSSAGPSQAGPSSIEPDKSLLKLIINDLIQQGVSSDVIKSKSGSELVKLHEQMAKEENLQQQQPLQPSQPTEDVAALNLPRVPVLIPEIYPQAVKLESWTVELISEDPHQIKISVHLSLKDGGSKTLFYSSMVDLLKRAPTKLLKELRKIKCQNARTGSTEGCEGLDVAIDTHLYALSLEEQEPASKRRKR